MMVYVIVQFLLLAVLAWPIKHLHLSFLSFSSLIGLALMLTGSVVAMLALHANRPGNFNVRPTAKVSGKLITTGIYHYIRHPMYCSLFFFALGLVFCHFLIYKPVVWVLLLLILALKARIEERSLLALYPEYKHYQQTTKAFIPFIW